MAARFLAVVLLLASASGQLRPRRVGTNALGEQHEMPSGGAGAGAGAAAGAGDMAAGLEEAMKMLGGQGGGGLDLLNNPMLKGLADANPEVAEMLSDPEKMKEQMAQMMKMFATPEGQEMANTMMSEMQSVLTDPEKLKSGLEQLTNNPALAGIADAVPGLREVLNDPDALDAQANKAAELFQAMKDPEKAQEMLSGLLGGEGGEGGATMAKLQEAMQMAGGEGMGDIQESIERMAQLMQQEGGLGGMGGLSELLEAAGGLDGEDDDDGGDALKARVREQLASMLHERGGGAELEEEF